MFQGKDYTDIVLSRTLLDESSGEEENEDVEEKSSFGGSLREEDIALINEYKLKYTAYDKQDEERQKFFINAESLQNFTSHYDKMIEKATLINKGIEEGHQSLDKQMTLLKKRVKDYHESIRTDFCEAFDRVLEGFGPVIAYKFESIEDPPRDSVKAIKAKEVKFESPKEVSRARGGSKPKVGNKPRTRSSIKQNYCK